MQSQCKLWKVIVGFQHGDAGTQVETPSEESKTFWAFNFTEAKARTAAIRWGENACPNSIVNILQVEQKH